MIPSSGLGFQPPFDADALERVLQSTRPEIRPILLEGMFPPMTRRQWGDLSRINDPVLQALFDATWQPFWDESTEEFLHDGAMDAYPVRRLVLERRRGSTASA